MKASIFFGTDVGKMRSHNEDNFVVIRGKNSEMMGNKSSAVWQKLTLRGEGIFFSVIDGMGGSAGGEVASSTVAKYIINNWPVIKVEKSDRIATTALENANENLNQLAETNSDLVKMGAVATACYLSGGSIYGSQVGDTRLYLLREGILTQVSEDQTFVSNLVRMGIITPKEAETHPQRNVVSQALGPGQVLKPVAFKNKIKAGDKLLVCSDGLHGLVPFKVIQNTLLQTNGDQTIESLLHLANEHGGTDNITAILVEISA
ncbi:MAG: protein phosphatase 2C domain-containing protein [Leptospira sp.]|nr:protein phosphatase 2C domain-containing protein [Leptospira sp.]